MRRKPSQPNFLGGTAWGPVCWVFAIAVATISAVHADEKDHPWSATVYYGPSTTKYFFAVLQKFNMQPTGTMLGLAVDRNLIYLGDDIYVGAEAQVTQFFFGHTDTTGAAGLGFRADNIFGLSRTIFSMYSGPSYDTDPPYTSIGYGGKILPAERRARFLNFVGAELAVGLPHINNWYGVIRIYHRSSMMGVYPVGDDAGIAVGIGLQYRF
jgi:hypothetical protein